MSDYKPPKRHETATQRDLKGQKARIERREHDQRREATQTGHTYAAPSEPFEDDVTGKYEGEELERMRARRPTPERLLHIERKQDVFSTRMTAIEISVADIAGQMKILPDLVETLQTTISGMQKDGHLRLGVQLAVNQADELAEIEAKKAAELAAIEAKRAADLDVIAAKKAARKVRYVIVAGLVAALSSGAFLHWLFGKL